MSTNGTSKDEQKEKDKCMRDGMAMFLLKDFILAGFPTPDPAKQVGMAFMYASLFVKISKQAAEEE